MQLNVTTDYAVRIVLYLAIKQKVVNSSEIAKAMGIPPTYIMKITRTLKSAGILSEKRGVDGGFVLDRKPEQLTLLDIVSALEKTVNINRCLEEDEFCSRNAVAFCNVRKLLVRLQAELAEGLNVKISELI
ncbi:MAG: Rrf2 family transcriptional regulator [Firmicutes bacterium]|nr:Rrf2 family transcriptional regulator [Bacillota bacterium]